MVAWTENDWGRVKRLLVANFLPVGGVFMRCRVMTLSLLVKMNSCSNRQIWSAAYNRTRQERMTTICHWVATAFHTAVDGLHDWLELSDNIEYNALISGPDLCKDTLLHVATIWHAYKSRLNNEHVPREDFNNSCVRRQSTRVKRINGLNRHIRLLQAT